MRTKDMRETPFRSVVPWACAVFAVGFLLWGALSCGGPEPGDGEHMALGVRSLLQPSFVTERSEECDPSVPGRGVTRPSICERARLVSTAANDLGVRARWELAGTTDGIATEVLAFYREAGSFELARAEYLDLYGQVWGCAVVASQGWVEVAIVDGRGGEDGSWDAWEAGGPCAVTVVRLGEKALADDAQTTAR